MTFLKMSNCSEGQIRQAASVLRDAMKDFSPAWPDLPSALDETQTFLHPDRLALLALEGTRVLGWIGAILQSKFLWELHPLVVHPNHQRKGIGRTLAAMLEAEARTEGVSTIFLGTDDEVGGTTLFGKDLYPDVLTHLQNLRAVSQHPFQFYKAVGYSVIGIIPDADGPGKHDILMAKRIS